MILLKIGWEWKKWEPPLPLLILSRQEGPRLLVALKTLNFTHLILSCNGCHVWFLNLFSLYTSHVELLSFFMLCYLLQWGPPSKNELGTFWSQLGTFWRYSNINTILRILHCHSIQVISSPLSSYSNQSIAIKINTYRSHHPAPPPQEG